MIDKDAYQGIMKEFFSHSLHGRGELGDGFVQYTNDGVLAIAAESTGRIGFGVAGCITPTMDVLTIVDTLNRTMGFGHYWLSPGAGDSDWSLICGFKFQYPTADPEDIAGIALGLMQSHGAIVDQARRNLAGVLHKPYWSAADAPGTQALVLVSHLG
ncbi:hypothetical protein [Corynebacterium variabile]|uniref:hypothetical protein n=1 Tax=Corynebacterium variabile TaxID=1727 RepID=UPI003A8E8219